MNHAGSTGEAPVWAVYFDPGDRIATITLTYHRLLPDGSTIKFDEDPACHLDLASEEDDRLLREGFMALIPPGQLMSCALRVLRRALLVWEYTDFEHIAAGADRELVAAAFAGRMYNPDGASPDALFVGGTPADHATTTILAAATRLTRLLQGPTGADEAAWEQALGPYTAIFFTESTETRMVTRADGTAYARAAESLAAVAGRHGLALPPL